MIERLYRQSLLGISEFKPVSGLMQRHGRRLGVSRFVAGETSEEAIAAIARLEAKGLKGILDLLGEFVGTQAGVEAMTAEILATLDRLALEPIDRYMSVKPTQLGLELDPALALDNARIIARRAKEVGAHVCLDMENFPYVEGTLRMYEGLHAEGFGNVSTVLQSYLKRTGTDLTRLLRLDPKPTLRIVKGAYRESAEVAYQDKAKVDRSYRELVRRGLAAGAKINVATHDETLIADAQTYLKEQNLGRERYEFQLLYGVRLQLQTRLADEGHLVRIYVPYGKDWYGYFSRRLAERPANLLFVVRGLFG
ncbi:MAG: proline dehydrogenase family protein [Deinococcota bacterium]|jgi:proline dehydrogenase|nr:proline dehydrogenase family protein [Deinococcota bacterium]